MPANDGGLDRHYVLSGRALLAIDEASRPVAQSVEFLDRYRVRRSTARGIWAPIMLGCSRRVIADNLVSRHVGSKTEDARE